MNSAIELDRVTKRFRVEYGRPRSFQERFVQVLRRQRTTSEEVSVLRDVSFDLPHGTSLGVIGPNGAGKSTLLKLCARVLEPTSGMIRVAGRVSALLELGVGFHPELTGRENVFLYGSLVGIERAKMKQRFDEIVAFSEIGRFIDLPVKFYSSGMYLRLAFAVAIHVDADMLLVDEAFAVGDAQFQRKCLDRIRQIQNAGVAMLLVSHSPDLIRELCTRAIWIQAGQVIALGDADGIVTAYGEQSANLQLALDGNHRWGSREIEITGVQFLDRRGIECRTFHTADAFVARINYVAHRRITHPIFGVGIHRDDGMHINGPNTRFDGYDIRQVDGPGSIDYGVDALNLLPGAYQFSASVYDQALQQAYDHHHRVYPFWVEPNPTVQERFGTFYMPAHWEHRAGG